MNDITRKLDELTAGFTDEQNNLFIENRFPYILVKADSYIKSGPEVYRNEDAFDYAQRRMVRRGSFAYHGWLSSDYGGCGLHS